MFPAKGNKIEGNPVPAKRFLFLPLYMFVSILSPPHGRWNEAAFSRAQSTVSLNRLFSQGDGGAGHLAVVMFLPCLAHVSCLIECLPLQLCRPPLPRRPRLLLSLSLERDTPLTLKSLAHLLLF